MRGNMKIFWSLSQIQNNLDTNTCGNLLGHAYNMQDLIQLILDYYFPG